MSSPFLGEIRAVSFNFAPRGWATCDGQLLAISQNTALFSLLGTNFGGNGTSNFGLPNLQGNVPMFWGNGANLSQRVIGETGGEQTVTIAQATMPTHNHNPFMADEEVAGDQSPAGDLYAGALLNTYAAAATTAVFAAATVETVGSSQPHDNMAPYLTMLYIIALSGIFPQRN